MRHVIDYGPKINESEINRAEKLLHMHAMPAQTTPGEVLKVSALQKPSNHGNVKKGYLI